jgi:hypothetical protein
VRQVPASMFPRSASSATAVLPVLSVILSFRALPVCSSSWLAPAPPPPSAPAPRRTDLPLIAKNLELLEGDPFHAFHSAFVRAYEQCP